MIPFTWEGRETDKEEKKERERMSVKGHAWAGYSGGRGGGNN